MSMKKHEACHHLNNLIEEKKQTRRWEEERLADNLSRQIKHKDTGELRDPTDAEKENWQKYYAEKLSGIDLQLAALDMAGDALTK
jgi:hypothetical protein